jgi:molybdopterin/thiamine biosynthesis adenylyltransferase
MGRARFHPGGAGPLLAPEGMAPGGDGRYARLCQVEMIGPEGVMRLQYSRVAVLGLGNIGGPLASHLALLGIPSVLVDRAMVTEANLGTQGFADQDVGLPKVEARLRALARLNPSWPVEGLQADITRLGLGRLRGVSLVFSCPDNVAARVAVNELSLRLGIPWVDAAVDGSGQSSFSRVAAYGGTPASACYLCAHDSKSLGQMLREDAGEGCPVWRWDGSGAVPAPTVNTSAVGSAVAAFQAVWGLKILLGRGHEVIGREMHLDLALPRLTTHALALNEGCLVDHRPYVCTALGKSVAEVTVAETFELGEARLGAGVVLGLHRRSLVTDLSCPACGRRWRPLRLLEAMGPAEGRCWCGASVQPSANGLRDRLRRDDVQECLKKTWSDLGLPEQDVVTASAGEQQLHFLFA